MFCLSTHVLLWFVRYFIKIKTRSRGEDTKIQHDEHFMDKAKPEKSKFHLGLMFSTEQRFAIEEER